MPGSKISITPRLAEPPTLARSAEKTVLDQVARFYNGGTPLDVLLDRLTEAERRLAKVAHALDDDGRRAA
jgi:hypothetical protein